MSVDIDLDFYQALSYLFRGMTIRRFNEEDEIEQWYMVDGTIMRCIWLPNHQVEMIPYGEGVVSKEVDYGDYQLEEQEATPELFEEMAEFEWFLPKFEGELE